MSGQLKLSCPSGGSVTVAGADTASNLTATIPAATDTLVNLASTQTLSNKTMTAASGNAVEATAGPTSTQLAGMRNKIINGAMMINQRGFGSTPANYDYLTDRFQFRATQSSKFTVTQSTTAPAGFTNSLAFTSSSSYSVGSTDQFGVRQFIEGVNISDLAWGTANAKSVTLSFWVYSSLTGTHSGALGNSGDARAYPFSFTVSSASTWEQKTVTIAGDTSDTWLTTTGIGIKVTFNLGAGSSMLGTANAWTAGEIVGVTGSVSVVGTNGATFYITGVQLEKGATATPFENRLYGTELALCQRYYWKLVNGNAQYVGTSQNWNSAQGQSVVSFPVTMRSSPSLDSNSGSSYWSIDVNTTTFGTSGSWNIYRASPAACLVYTSTFSGLTTGQAGSLYSSNASSYMAFSAEL